MIPAELRRLAESWATADSGDTALVAAIHDAMLEAGYSAWLAAHHFDEVIGCKPGYPCHVIEAILTDGEVFLNGGLCDC